MLLIFFVAIGTSHAEPRKGVLKGAELELDQREWRTIEGEMSEQEYRNAYRSNQRLLRDVVKSYSEDTLISLGVPKKGVSLIGAAAGLAVTQDAKLYLHKSKLLALEFKDVTDNDRSLFLGVKLDWD
jgi:hypothetical protein